jgi:hypothetical protein
MIFPGVSQSLPQITPPQLAQITAPPPLSQLPAPPVNYIFDGSFGRMLENIMMPREYGFKSQSYVSNNIDEDMMDSLPPPQQVKYIEKQTAGSCCGPKNWGPACGPACCHGIANLNLK